MMVLTVRGRWQTKIVTLAVMGLTAATFAVAEQCILYLQMFAIAIAVGFVLETIWGILIDYEPGWLTALFALIEFSIILSIAAYARLPDLSGTKAAIMYLTAFVASLLVVRYLLPVWRTTWLDDGGELW